MLFTTITFVFFAILDSGNSANNYENPNLKFDPNTKGSGDNEENISILEGVGLDEEGEKSGSFERNHFTIVNSNQQLEEVLHSGTLQLLIFLYLDDTKWKNQLDSQNLLEFLQNYDDAAAHLSKYSIVLGLVNCSSDVTNDYCAIDKSGNFAHGFQRQQEKIGFPIETLFSVDSIVASTLHLSLLYSVPIIQSLAERRGLEDKHRFKKDIILSLHKSLGTREHRLFLEVSEKLKTSFAFSITTYSSAIYGLPNIPSPEEISELNPLIFILHCSNGQTQSQDDKESDAAADYEAKSIGEESDPCAVVSVYEGAFQYSDFNDFLNRFREPLWDDIDPNCLSKASRADKKFFEDLTLPKVVFIYDSKWQKRVFSTVPTISKLLIGNVNVFTIDVKNLSEEIQNFLKISLSEIRTPAVLFFYGHQETSILNDYDDAVSWVREELKSLKMDRRRGDNQDEIRAIHQLFDLEELQEDDEVAKGMVSEDNFTLVPPLKGIEEFKKVLEKHQSGVLAIAFHLPWDPVSNVLLQHLQKTTQKTKEMGSSFQPYRVNCFDWTDICDSIDTVSYPVLKLWNPNKTSIIYNGPIDARQFALTVLLLECNDQPLNITEGKSEFPFASFTTSNSCLALKETSSFAIGLFSSREDASVFIVVAKLLYGYKLTGIKVDKEAVKEKCLGNTNGCVIISKKDDYFQPQFVIKELLNDSKSLQKLIEFHTENVFGPLNPSNAAVMNFEDDCKPESAAWRNVLVVLILESCETEGVIGELTNHIQKNIQSLLDESASSISDGGFCSNFFEEELKTSFLKEETSSQKSTNGTNKILSEEDRFYFIDVGSVAEQLSSPGLVFSYICSKDELGKDLLNTYNLRKGQSHLVAIKKGEGKVFALENQSPARNEIRKWLKYVLIGQATPKILLPSEDWTPVLEGFDYLSYLEEDMVREAEEQLAYDMEFDIGAYNNRGNKPYVRMRN